MWPSHAAGRWDQPGVDQSGALSSAKGANCPGTPLGPFEVAAHDRPSLLSQPALPSKPPWGFPPFHTPQVPGPRLAPAGSSEAFRDTGRSLQRLHLDPSLSSPPFPACPSPTPPCAALGVLSLQQSQSATPEGFELPGAQGSGQRPEGPASGPAAHTIWGFSHVEPEARTAPSNPPPPPRCKCPGDTRPRGQCTPYCGEGGSTKPRKQHGGWTMRGTSPFAVNKSESNQGSTPPTVSGSVVFRPPRFLNPPRGFTWERAGGPNGLRNHWVDAFGYGFASKERLYVCGCREDAGGRASSVTPYWEEGSERDTEGTGLCWRTGHVCTPGHGRESGCAGRSLLLAQRL